MFKWFAPLLLLAGKPDLLIRLVAAVIAAAVLFFGVWLLSNIALTFDALKNPYIAVTYAQHPKDPLRTRRSFTRATPRGLFGRIGLMAAHSWSVSS